MSRLEKKLNKMSLEEKLQYIKRIDKFFGIKTIEEKESEEDVKNIK